MPVRVAINGFGRIGRCLLRALFERGDQGHFEVVAINELADNETLCHLTKYDSTHGRFPGQVELSGDRLVVNDQTIQLLHQPKVGLLPWRELAVDLVFECTGSFSDRHTAEQHITAGAERVLFSQPADSDVDATLVMGVNESQLSSNHRIVSAASCTTNAVTPVLALLQDQFGIESAQLRTIHAAMHDQPVIDAYHHTDLRKTRAAFGSLIPVDTGLARGIDRILPELSGRVEATAIRVPVADVSAMDISVLLKKTTTAEDLNRLLLDAANEFYKDIIGYTEEPLASCDFVHDARSGVIDAGQTRVANERLAKILIWFDNEWGYANRMLDVASYWNRLK